MESVDTSAVLYGDLLAAAPSSRSEWRSFLYRHTIGPNDVVTDLGYGYVQGFSVDDSDPHAPLFSAGQHWAAKTDQFHKEWLPVGSQPIDSHSISGAEFVKDIFRIGLENLQASECILSTPKDRDDLITLTPHDYPHERHHYPLLYAAAVEQSTKVSAFCCPEWLLLPHLKNDLPMALRDWAAVLVDTSIARSRPLNNKDLLGLIW